MEIDGGDDLFQIERFQVISIIEISVSMSQNQREVCGFSEKFSSNLQWGNG